MKFLRQIVHANNVTITQRRKYAFTKEFHIAVGMERTQFNAIVNKIKDFMKWVSVPNPSSRIVEESLRSLMIKTSNFKALSMEL
jgi:hypothetical protein